MTSIREEYLNLNHPEFPKFVFCIPQELTHLRASYEEQLWIITSNSYDPPESWKSFPFRVTPMIFDMGYMDGSGFDTSFALCHRMNTSWRFLNLWFNQKELGNLSLNFHSSNSIIPFLDIFFSLNPSPNDVFLSSLKRLQLTLQESLGSCTDFTINNLKRTEFLRIGKDCLTQETGYNPVFCLDRCIQQEIRKRMDNRFR